MKTVSFYINDDPKNPILTIPVQRILSTVWEKIKDDTKYLLKIATSSDGPLAYAITAEYDVAMALTRRMFECPGDEIMYLGVLAQEQKEADEIPGADEDLTFPQAFAALVAGEYEVIFLGRWTGKQWIKCQTPDENSKMTEPYIYLETPDGFREPWTPTQYELFADNWMGLRGEEE